jgi:hypothetical protein
MILENQIPKLNLWITIYILWRPRGDRPSHSPLNGWEDFILVGPDHGLSCS